MAVIEWLQRSDWHSSLKKKTQPISIIQFQFVKNENKVKRNTEQHIKKLRKTLIQDRMKITDWVYNRVKKEIIINKAAKTSSRIIYCLRLYGAIAQPQHWLSYIHRKVSFVIIEILHKNLDAASYACM